MRPIAFLTAVIVVLLGTSPSARGQAYSSSNPFPPNNEFGVWGAYSFSNAHVIGTTSDRQIGALALRYSRTIYDSKRVALLYTLDLVPVEMLRQPTYTTCTVPPNMEIYCLNGRESVYGGGISPVGLRLNFRRTRRVQPFGASSGGFVASVRPVPVDIPGGTQFNFTFEFGAGLQVFNTQRSRAWTFGYKFQHISNAYRQPFNPGVDANLFFLGYSFFR